MVKNILHTLITRGMVAMINFLILLLISRYLGSSNLGIISQMILSISIIQTVNEIYTGSALVYFVPQGHFTRIYWQGFVFTLVCIVLINPVFMVFNLVQPGMSLHVALLSFLVSLHYFHTVLLLAREKMAWYNRVIFLQPFLLLLSLGTAVFLFKQNQLETYLLCFYFSYILSLLVSGGMVLFLPAQAATPHTVSFAQVFRNGLLNQLGNLAHTLSNRLNYYLLGTTALVGVYAGSSSLIESLWIISGSVSPVILTHIANNAVSERNSRISFLLAKLCFLLSLACVFILLLLPNALFVFLLGTDFGEAKSIMLYLSPGVLLLSFSSILSHYFSGLGNQKLLFVANVSGLLAAVCSAYPLIHSFGVYGACYSAGLSYLVQALIISIAFMKKNAMGLRDLLSLRNDVVFLKGQKN